MTTSRAHGSSASTAATNQSNSSRAAPEQVASSGKTRDGRVLKPRTYPKFDSLEDERLYRKQHLAGAFRIFADRGFDEGIAGHISVRDPILTDHFCMSTAPFPYCVPSNPNNLFSGLNPLSMHFSLIKVSDLILCDEDGNVVQGNECVNTAAFAIHSELHKARPDVTAACHAHSVHGKAFAAFGRELEMITQDALRFYKSHGVYKHFGGVAVDVAEGRRIAQALGDGKAAILQNHGLITVGQSVDEAAFWFISLDKTCQAQLLADAAAAGGYEKQVIDEEEAAHSAQQLGGPEKGWLCFQPCKWPTPINRESVQRLTITDYDEILFKTKGDFLN